MAPTSDRGLLARILQTPQLERVVPRLEAQVVHRLIEACGLEDSASLVALLTPQQLTGVFDFDLWNAAHPGADDRFDATRFARWLEVIVESGVAAGAAKLADMDAGLITAAFAQHVFVFDLAALPATGGRPRPNAEIGGYLVVPKGGDAWDALVEVLSALDANHQACFHRVMQGCRRLSNSAPEIDGLHALLGADAQTMFDLAASRDERREQSGYLSAPQARAFLTMSRQLRRDGDPPPGVHAIARAYFREIATPAPAAPQPAPGQASVEAGAAAVVELLVDAGVLPRPPRALLEAADAGSSRLSHIRAQLTGAAARGPESFATRNGELAFLANAVVAGGSVQGRAFTPEEASEAVLSTCNLGLENWPASWPAPDDYVAEHGLIGVFQFGWSVLHQDVSLYAAEQLVAVLAKLRVGDRETQAALTGLRREMAKQWKAGTPWRARRSLEVIAMLDMPAWAALLALCDECPVLAAATAASLGSGVRQVSATAFEFISENRQIASVRAFMTALPETLRG
ncbi:MAG TPA: DUF6178 family protein [Vicinamibacterales bacterium]|nr:DUF6178 family protein [Vicinamibacterales bacterium]